MKRLLIIIVCVALITALFVACKGIEREGVASDAGNYSATDGETTENISVSSEAEKSESEGITEDESSSASQTESAEGSASESQSTSKEIVELISDAGGYSFE